MPSPRPPRYTRLAGGDPDTDSDVESQLSPRTSPSSGAAFANPTDPPVPLPADSVPVEYQTRASTKYLFLLLYFSLNLVLTLSNKAILIDLPFPWLLTTFHTTTAAVGISLLLLFSRPPSPPSPTSSSSSSTLTTLRSALSFSLSSLTRRSHLTLIAFSVLFTVNIALSNISLGQVSLPFHQTIRSTVPIFIVIPERLFFNRTYSSTTYLSLIPLIVGPSIAAYGDYYFTLVGLLFTLAGAISASAKMIVTNRIMTGPLKLPALELLFRMAPLAAVQALTWAIANGEVAAFVAYMKSSADTGERSRSGRTTTGLIILLAANSFIAFVLNITSFQTNKLAGPLSISVGGNVKQIVTIVVSTILFHLKVTPLNTVGMVITMIGGGWYSKVEIDNKSRQKREAVLPPPSPPTGNDFLSPNPADGTTAPLLSHRHQPNYSTAS